MTSNTEFRSLMAKCYGGRGAFAKFAEETGYTRQGVSNWAQDRKEVPRIVILFLRERAAVMALRELVTAWADKHGARSTEESPSAKAAASEPGQNQAPDTIPAK